MFIYFSAEEYENQDIFDLSSGMEWQFYPDAPRIEENQKSQREAKTTEAKEQRNSCVECWSTGRKFCHDGCWYQTSHCVSRFRAPNTFLCPKLWKIIGCSDFQIQMRRRQLQNRQEKQLWGSCCIKLFAKTDQKYELSDMWKFLYISYSSALGHYSEGHYSKGKHIPTNEEHAKYTPEGHQVLLNCLKQLKKTIQV